MNTNVTKEEDLALQEYLSLGNARYDEVTARVDVRDSAIARGMQDMHIGPGQAERGYENDVAAWNAFGDTVEGGHGTHTDLHGGQLHRLNRMAQGHYRPPPPPRVAAITTGPATDPFVEIKATDPLKNVENPGAKGLAHEVNPELIHKIFTIIEDGKPVQYKTAEVVFRAPRPPTPPGSNPSRLSGLLAAHQDLITLIPPDSTTVSLPPPAPTKEVQQSRVFYGSLKSSRYAD